MHDLRLNGLASYALKRGGSIHPMILPPELTGETGLMNPSIYVHNGKILMNIRHVNYTLYHSEGKKFPHKWGPLQYIHPENQICLATHNVMCELDDDMNMIDHGRINMVFDTGKPTWNFHGLEDGRLFSWDEKLYLCGVRRDVYDDKGTGRMEMAEIDFVDGEWREISRNPIPAPPPNLTYCEKNWMPVIDKPWHFVKWCNPTEVVHYNIETRETTTAILDESKRIECERDIRGGSQVVRIDDKWVAITHEIDLYKDTHGRKDGHYVHRVVVWDDDWNIVKTTKEFTFSGFQIDPTTGNEFVIEFVTGLAFHKGNALISYGLQDNACMVLKMPQQLFFDFILKG